LEVWAETGPPLLAWYEGRGMLRVVDGVGSTDEVSSRIDAVVVESFAGLRPSRRCCAEPPVA
jgi:hypothetical protein